MVGWLLMVVLFVLMFMLFMWGDIVFGGLFVIVLIVMWFVVKLVGVVVFVKLSGFGMK